MNKANENKILTKEQRQEKLETVEGVIEQLLIALDIDFEHDHNTMETPHRVAKMYVNEVFKGRYTECPKMKVFPNVKKVDQIYTSNAITVRSCCSHHLVPIIGKCWIGIVPGDKLIGLSKLNRLVDWFASRPQIQEELTAQIADRLEELIKPKGIAVVIKAQHGCVVWRGVRESLDSSMTTSDMRGCFVEAKARAEFMSLIALK